LLDLKFKNFHPSFLLQVERSSSSKDFMQHAGIQSQWFPSLHFATVRQVSRQYLMQVFGVQGDTGRSAVPDTALQVEVKPLPALG
jgi:hypothetical protein